MNLGLLRSLAYLGVLLAFCATCRRSKDVTKTARGDLSPHVLKIDTPPKAVPHPQDAAVAGSAPPIDMAEQADLADRADRKDATAEAATIFAPQPLLGPFDDLRAQCGAVDVATTCRSNSSDEVDPDGPFTAECPDPESAWLNPTAANAVAMPTELVAPDGGVRIPISETSKLDSKGGPIDGMSLFQARCQIPLRAGVRLARSLHLALHVRTGEAPGKWYISKELAFGYEVLELLHTELRDIVPGGSLELVLQVQAKKGESAREDLFIIGIGPSGIPSMTPPIPLWLKRDASDSELGSSAEQLGREVLFRAQVLTEGGIELSTVQQERLAAFELPAGSSGRHRLQFP